MIKRTLYFGNPAHLKMRDEQMIIDIGQNEAFISKSVPIEDIGFIILDHPQITITHALIQFLQGHNVAMLTCDQRHMPQSLLLPLEGNTIQQERYDLQLAASEPLKKQLWAQTVSYKISNQAAMLKSQSMEYKYLLNLIKTIKSGDATNCEATAAAFYWCRIFSFVDGFKRYSEGIPPNNYLNYGYAILRATMARSIVMSGLLPTLGIHHANRYNAFCLADDLMEPYRPYVDKIVFEMVAEKGASEILNREAKATLLNIPAMDVLLNGEKSPLMNATQRTAVSLVKCYEGAQRKILYPEFI
jgi:CRISPR-associated protein Cas1